MLGAAFSEEQGGLGGGALENAIIMEELGKVIGIEPYLPTVVIAGGALKAVGGAQAVDAGGLHCGAGQQPCQGGDAAAHHALVPRTACTRATPLRQPMASATGAGRLASQPRE